jgi:hypothetical protein
MKRMRVAILLALIFGLLLAALFWSRPHPESGFATPGDCLDAYRDACKTGNVGRYLSCLAEPLRSDKGDATAEQIRKEMQDVKSWTQLDPEIKHDSAIIDVDAVRRSGTRRIRFHLARSDGGWLITAIDAPRELPGGIPYGTSATD